MTELQLLMFLLPKIMVATICGLIIGWEREIKNKVAGIRTHVLICVGACLFTVLGFIIVGHPIDPTRIIGQIITGIGFLGGGVIFKNENRIEGVTSAAFIWFIASVGALAGIGYLAAPIVLTIGQLAISIILQKLETKIKIK
jgi:putative Mg2+ transporter-C (MgtC) family protein